MNNLNLMVEEKNKKEKRKKIIKLTLIFTALVLILTWFVASFIHNKPINNEEIKTELVEKKFNNETVNYSISENMIYLGYSNKVVDSVIYYEGINYNNFISYDIYLEYDFVNDYVISSTITFYFNLNNDNDNYYFTYHFDPDDLNDFVFDVYFTLTFDIFQTLDLGYTNFYMEGYDNDGTVLLMDTSLYIMNSYQNFNCETLLGLQPTKYKDDFYFIYFYDIIEYLKSYYNLGYDEGYDQGYDIGYDEGYDIGYDNGYEDGITDLQKQDIATNGFKTLFNAILNAPYNIYSKLLNFEFLGVNLFNLFSFIVTTSLIMWIIKLFKK